MTAKRKVKTKKCKVCPERFEVFNSLQFVCSVNCALVYAKKETEKNRKAETKAAKEKLKTNSQWIKEAQVEFNKFIRLRDSGDSCISCSRVEKDIENHVGGKWDAGHYKTRGAYPELRFEEYNCHKQCKKCNGGAGRFSKKDRSVSERYRANLIKKIGLKRVEWLEGPHEPKKYSIDEIKAIKQCYKDKCKIINQRTL